MERPRKCYGRNDGLTDEGHSYTPTSHSPQGIKKIYIRINVQSLWLFYRCSQRNVQGCGEAHLFPKKMLVILKTGIHKLLVRIANREDPDWTASSEAV